MVFTISVALEHVLREKVELPRATKQVRGHKSQYFDHALRYLLVSQIIATCPSTPIWMTPLLVEPN